MDHQDQRQVWIRDALDTHFTLWVGRFTAWGAVVFFLAGAFDVFIAPEHFSSFIVLRIIIASVLAGIAYFSISSPGRGIRFHGVLGYLGIVGVAMVLEVMVLAVDVQAPYYYVAMMLLGICSIGFIPGGRVFHLATGVTICLVYAVPALAALGPPVRARVILDTLFMAMMFLAVLFLRRENTRHLRAELGLRYELDAYKDGLEGAVKSRTLRLVESVANLQGEMRARLKVEAELRRREAFLESVLESIQDGISVLDRDLRIIRVNKTMETWYKHRLPIEGKRCFDVYHGRTERCETCPSVRTLKSGEAQHEEVPLTGSSGVCGWLDLYSFPLRDSATGEVSGIIEYVRDITARKEGERKVAKAYRMMIDILEKAPFGIYVVNGEGTVDFVNPAMLRISGASYDRFKGTNIWELPGYGKLGLPEMIRSPMTGESFFLGPVEYGAGKDGKVTIQNFHGIPFEQEGEKKALVFVEDVTGLKEMERRILREKRDWEDTFNTITDMITIHDEQFNIIRANRAARDILGLPELSTSRAKCFTYFHGEERPGRDCPSCRSLATGKPVTEEMFEPHLGRYIEVRAIPRLDSGNAVAGMIHVVRDITDRKSAEERLTRHLEHLAALRKIDLAIAGNFDIRDTLRIFLEEALPQLGVDTGAILLVLPQGNRLEYVYAVGRGAELFPGLKVPWGETWGGQVVLEKRRKVLSEIGEEDLKGMPWHPLKKPEFRAFAGFPLIAKGKVRGVLELYHGNPLRGDGEWLELAAALADVAAIAVDNATLFQALDRSNRELAEAYERTIEGWSRALDYRDKETEGHSQRVTDMTVRIARRMGLPEQELGHMRRGALLHDIGKLGIPDGILLKPTTLTEEEQRIMERHPEIAYRLLSPIPFLKPSLAIPFCHHERWDGTGYPQGLQGIEIPLAARIFAVVDVWDALRSARPYRPPWSDEDVAYYIRTRAATEFDPAVVRAFLAELARLEASPKETMLN